MGKKVLWGKKGQPELTPFRDHIMKSFQLIRGSWRGLAGAGIVAMSLSYSGCGFFPESSFELSPQSRVPKWFSMPPGLSRSDVSVKMDYYVGSSGATAKFTLLTLKGSKLAKVDGKVRDLQPVTLQTRQSKSSSAYPSFEIVTSQGITEIIEHRRPEPIFYINDDPAVRAELGVSDQRKKGSD